MDPKSTSCLNNPGSRSTEHVESFSCLNTDVSPSVLPVESKIGRLKAGCLKFYCIGPDNDRIPPTEVLCAIIIMV